MKYTDHALFCWECGTRCDTARLTMFKNAQGKPVCWSCDGDADEPKESDDE